MLKMGAVELLVTMVMGAPNLVGGIFGIVSLCVLGILFHQEFFFFCKCHLLRGRAETLVTRGSSLLMGFTLKGT